VPPGSTSKPAVKPIKPVKPVVKPAGDDLPSVRN
jgi:hypothetical protein